MLDPVFEALSYAGSFGFVWLAIALAISGFTRSRPWLWAVLGVAIAIALRTLEAVLRQSAPGMRQG